MKKFAPVVLALGLSVSAMAAPVLRNPVAIPSPYYGWELIEADFNGDGHADVLLIGQDSTLIVHLSNGTGPFAPPVITPALDTLGPGIGDFNGDGKIDVVVASYADHLGTVMLGNGDGTFHPGPTFDTIHGARAMHAGHFNGDPHLDLVVTTFNPSSGSNVVYVHFGDGTGHLSGALTTTITEWIPYQQPTDLDLNGDGKTDLISDTRVFLGNGTGGFTGLAYDPLGSDFVAGDFNHDGKRDLASLSNWINVVLVALGNGDGTFQKVAYPAGYTYGSIDAGDVNGDGQIDLLVAGSTGTSAVGVLLGKGDGTFHPPARWLSNYRCDQMVAGDFDRDGKLDFVTALGDELRALSFVPGNGDGTFKAYRAFRPGAGVEGGFPADMNGDGKQDVVVLQEHDEDEHQPRDLAVLLNDGSGKLAAPILSPTGEDEESGFSIGDLNNDGKSDAVLVSSPEVRTLLGNGNGTFAAPVLSSISNSGISKLGHFNGDSNIDLFVGYDSSVVYPGLGNGTFGAGIQSTIADAWLFGDLNGDGKLDLITNGSISIQAGVNDGSGHFSSQLITSDKVTPRALADFNGDQKLDLLITTSAGMQVRPGNGDGTFGAPVNVVVNPVPSYLKNEPVAVADFDGDGKMDASVGTSIFLGNGDGTFRSRARFRTFEVDYAQAADMDGSGSPDLVTTSRDTGEIFVLLTGTTNDPTESASITLSTDKSVAHYAEAVTLTATVTGGTVPLFGVVTFALDDVPWAIIEVKDGQAKFKSPFPVGGHTVSATYHDENYLPSTASTGLTIVKAITTTTISGAPNPRSQGLTVTITAKLNAPQAFGWAKATGALTLRDGVTPLPLTLVNDKAQISTLSQGSHVISVDYPGDANYEPATASYTQVITKPVPPMRMLMTPSEVMAGSPATFTVDFPSSPNVTGSITFHTYDSTPYETVPMVNGVATLQRTFPWGHHYVEAEYSGDDTWAFTQGLASFYAHIGPWGTPIVVDARGYSGGGSGSVNVSWSRITGAVTYTLWKKASLAGPWQPVDTVPPDTPVFSPSLPLNTSALFAVTATDGSGNVSPMSAPDLATTVSFADLDLQPNFNKVKAQHFLELRQAIASVRTFAALSAYSYANTIAAGQPIRAADIQQMRTALAQARTAIGLPAVAYTDPTLTPSASVIRAAHVEELRTGAN